MSGRQVADNVTVRMRIQVDPDQPTPFVDVEADGRVVSFLPDVARGLALDIMATLGAIERFEATHAERAARKAAE